ncbi:MAG TPA: pyrroline-5-carboxylate reductase dimerization domain-containing protein, partial [Acidimicrobiales bacterium]|nr:pyrroline-5-carboxylate reductase dimerization domain-containing protein [Acidimicrobiales bacterium]
ENGLDPIVADLLTRQTLLGASSLLSKSGVTPSELRASVTSPNGTTAAAISYLENEKFLTMMGIAIAEATQRSKELGS